MSEYASYECPCGRKHDVGIECAIGRRIRVTKELADTDPMPFGQYKGKPMQDVPACYLHWLWCNGKKDDHQCPVADYIRRNINALAHEYRDAIWH